MKKTLILTACLLLGVDFVCAQQFGEYFEDRTLRLDYIFAGNNTEQHIFFEQAYTTPQLGRPQKPADRDAAARQRANRSERPRYGSAALRPHLLHPVPGMAGHRGGHSGEPRLRGQLQRAHAQTARSTSTSPSPTFTTRWWARLDPHHRPRRHPHPPPRSQRHTPPLHLVARQRAPTSPTASTWP